MLFDKYIVNVIYYALKCEWEDEISLCAIESREDEFGLCAEAKSGR